MKKNKLLIISLSLSLLTVLISYFWLIKSSKSYNEPLLVIVAVSITIVGTLFSSIRLKKKERKIFIIYSHIDKEIAKKIYKALKVEGFKVIIDEDVIYYGDNINAILKSSINDVNTLIFIISKNSNKSKWVRMELDLAVNSNKEIIPVLLEEVDIPESVKNLKYADFRNKHSMMEAVNINLLVNGIKEKYSAQQSAKRT